MEQEFWTNIICCFKQEGCLQEESFNRLSEFMTQENFGFLFEGEVPENYDYEACKNKLANDFVTLKRQYEERNLSLSRFPEEMLALKAKYAVNEDFYIKQNFTKAEIYIVLYEVFKDKYERLLEHCKQNICYEKYGKYRYGNCY